MPSMTLERSRAVLMTHFAPWLCRSPMSCCKSGGTGGFSNSACRVPSKSVEINLIGNDIGQSNQAGSAGVLARSIGHKPMQYELLRTGTSAFPDLARDKQSCHIDNCQRIMPEAQQLYDDAMFDFSRAEYDACIAKLKSILAGHPDHFDAQLSLGMAYYR